jgi:hypothetical protein
VSASPGNSSIARATTSLADGAIDIGDTVIDASACQLGMPAEGRRTAAPLCMHEPCGQQAGGAASQLPCAIAAGLMMALTLTMGTPLSHKIVGPWHRLASVSADGSQTTCSPEQRWQRYPPEAVDGTHSDVEHAQCMALAQHRAFASCLPALRSVLAMRLSPATTQHATCPPTRARAKLHSPLAVLADPSVPATSALAHAQHGPTLQGGQARPPAVPHVPAALPLHPRMQQAVQHAAHHQPPCAARPHLLGCQYPGQQWGTAGNVHTPTEHGPPTCPQRPQHALVSHLQEKTCAHPSQDAAFAAECRQMWHLVAPPATAMAVLQQLGPTPKQAGSWQHTSVRFLGTGSSEPSKYRGPTGIVLQARF